MPAPEPHLESKQAPLPDSIALGRWYEKGQTRQQPVQRNQPNPSPSTCQQEQNGSFYESVSHLVGDLFTTSQQISAIVIS